MLVHKADGSPVLVFGLSFKNVEELKKDRPILLDLSELGLGGLMVITAKNDQGEAAMPQVEEATALVLTHEDLDRMVNRQMLTVGFQSGGSHGEVVIFSAKDEHTMEQMFKDRDFDIVRGSTCAKCGTGRREDGSCDCPETMQ